MADLEDDVGASFTGKTATAPMQNIMTPAPQPGGGFLSSPADRAALLQIGLNLMQPRAIGQSGLGHVAGSIGAGGEAVDRVETSDLKEATANSKLAIADERLRIAQQNADTRERKGLGSAIKGMTAYQLYQQSRNDKKDEATAAKEAKKDELAAAQRIVDQAESLKYTDPKHPTVQKYGNKTADEIVEMRRGGGGGGGATNKPTTVTQGGHTYTLQPDGSYK